MKKSLESDHMWLEEQLDFPQQIIRECTFCTKVVAFVYFVLLVPPDRCTGFEPSSWNGHCVCYFIDCFSGSLLHAIGRNYNELSRIKVIQPVIQKRRVKTHAKGSYFVTAYPLHPLLTPGNIFQ